MRRTSAAVALLALTGCVHDGLWEGASDRNRAIKSPLSPRQQLAQEKTAERVHALGRRIIDQNTFTGLEPVFHLVGKKEPMLFHRGTGELFVSDGLVAQCKSEDDLAAVLCVELGRMVAEKRGELAMGRDIDPSSRGPVKVEDVPGAEPVGASAQARPRKKEETDPAKVATELMRGAGFDPATIERIEPLLKATQGNDAVRKQMAGSAAAPVWKN